ncbi:hypothetical protein ATE69_11605 [Sphingopyxis sp. H071]|uniref:hypothetical protein n=2 Tax=unclassified Sphingopyxis TaxID=2614943 RepID=UPI0007317E0D|nr:hypothetical protein [Sphingopyxis sp. H071]KTE25760.1 hypothetical protein ATE61_08450 [Sphingopyxis sp. H057]KTE51441.1 hypothetical protein ATE64_12870 [Sphingopyxis sp. H073]KTE60339.1 hypothetical protein ATE66_09015 [Sphingopyxis sp. H107]KTE65682.1 hypothetical protein ATE65_09130 [Sphingopyxis sp. H100]KTE73287.1 hypothetical protein ATE60_07125 [Sphingopyxis sp. H081]KTE81158.1 hypothetical protein ATE63_07790 [Sphingopyxis sp. H067]
MRSFFPEYPAGTLGAGLLLMRFSNAASLALDPLPAAAIHSWLTGLLALALLLGLRTRAAALTGIFMTLWEPPVGESTAMLLCHLSALAALMLGGPGAYSADARSFGRRTITLPGKS